MTSETDRTTVTLTVVVAGETRTFTGETTTNGNPHRAAQALVDAIRGDANGWLQDRKFAAPGGVR